MTTQTELISIIMPVFNGEKYLKHAVESVLGQTYPHWELIVIDDGSTDDTAKIIQSYPDPRIRYIFQENRGQAAALNQGLNLASGDFVTTLDADDWYPPHSLFDRATVLAQNPAIGAVYGDGYYCNEAGENLLSFSEHMPNGINGDVFDMLIVSPFYGTGATVLIRKQILDQFRIIYDESIVWCQDWDFYIRLAANSAFEYADSISIYYRLHDEGMTVAMPKGRRLDSLVRTRQKVLTMPRFQNVSIAQKSAFFFDFLMKDLKDNPTEQTAVFESKPFRELPAKEQSRLLRITAITYILDNQHVNLAKKWLQLAWKQAPFDPKTAVVACSAMLNISFARQIIKTWQRNQPPAEEISPFQLALPPTKSTK